MKIFEWNVNCAIGSKNGRNCLATLFKKKPDSDILILTEFYKLNDYDNFVEKLNNWGYETFITEEQIKRNDVFIAISKKFEPKLYCNRIIRGVLPDLLIVSFTFNNLEYLLVGTRFFGSYSDMKTQFLNFLPLINGFTKVIVAGDFNNGKIYGDETQLLLEKEINDIYNGYDHIDYNYHRIKLWFYNANFSIITPTKGISCPYKSPYKGGSKIDHFATKNIEIKDVEYKETTLSDHNQLVGILVIE